MSSQTINFPVEFVEACRRLWRDGYDKGVNGDDDYPDISKYFPETCLPVAPKPSSPQKSGDVSYEEMEKLPFNPLKCEARLEKHGYAIQCTRNPFEGGCLCKTHMNQLSKVHKECGEDKDLPYGRFNQSRPDVTLDCVVLYLGAQRRVVVNLRKTKHQFLFRSSRLVRCVIIWRLG